MLKGYEPALRDGNAHIEELYNELVEWTASILTQYTIPELWAMDFESFHHVLERARSVQKKRIQAQKRGNKKRGRRSI